MGWHNAVSNDMDSGPQVVLMLLWWRLIQLSVILSDVCDWQRVGCLCISGGTKLAVCGAASVVYGCVVSGTSAASAGDFGHVGAVSNSQSVSMAFLASVTICLVMASCNSLMAVIKQSVAVTAGSEI